MADGTKTPWHLWVVGAVSVLWNGFGATDFTMSAILGDGWYRMMGATDAQIAQFNAMPGWMWGAWVLGVYGAIAGSVLLLLRRKWAVQAFAVSLVGAVISLVYQAFLAPPGGPGAVFPIIIVLIAGFLLWYAWAMAKRGVLR